MIHICFNYHDGYYILPQVMVASLLDTKNPDTQYTLHVMYNTLRNELKNKLEEIVDNRAIVNYIDMSSEFSLYKEDCWNVTAMYRLAIAEHLKNVDKIIYIDGDCLVFDDLTNMYNIDMNDNLFMGQADYKKTFKICCNLMKTDFKKYICSGVMLMNLKLLREYNFKDKVNDYLNRNNGDTHCSADQGVLNYLCKDKIDYLPARYGFLWHEYCYEDVLISCYLHDVTTPLYYSEKEYIDGFKNVAILHLIMNPFGKKAFHYPYGITDRFGRKFFEIAYKYNIINKVPNTFILKTINNLFVNVDEENNSLKLGFKNNITFTLEDEYLYIKQVNKYVSINDNNEVVLTEEKRNKWIIYPNVNRKTYQIYARNKWNFVLDIDHSMLAPGTKLQIYEMNDTVAQDFIISNCV